MACHMQWRIEYPKSDFRVPRISRKMGLWQVNKAFLNYFPQNDKKLTKNEEIQPESRVSGTLSAITNKY